MDKPPFKISYRDMQLLGRLIVTSSKMLSTAYSRLRTEGKWDQTTDEVLKMHLKKFFAQLEETINILQSAVDELENQKYAHYAEHAAAEMEWNIAIAKILKEKNLLH